MDKDICILVLGVGGNVGQGILKALAISNIPHRVIGACVSPYACGLYMTHKSYVSPYFNDPHFMDWIIETCQKEKIDAILTGVEPVLAFLSEHSQEIKIKTGAICIASPPEKLTIALDKFLTCQWLEQNGFHFPKYTLPNDESSLAKLVAEQGYPLIAKPRYGRSGAGIIFINDEKTLEVAKKQENYVIQEYIGDENSEYTVGTFTDNAGKLAGTIVMKRELQSGTTVRAEVGEFPEIKAEAERIIKKLSPSGPCNLQLRMSAQGKPVCFEINMRFSGTTPLRARFGFNEVAATLENFILHKSDISLPIVTSGIALRYWNEMYIDSDAYQELLSTKKLENPQRFQVIIENQGHSA